jgi:hypothetical protein
MPSRTLKVVWNELCDVFGVDRMRQFQAPSPSLTLLTSSRNGHRDGLDGSK